MGDSIQRLKWCITDLKKKIEFAEDRSRRAKGVLTIKERRVEVLLENLSLMRRKLALSREKLHKTYELLDEKHQQLEEVDECLHTSAVMCKELTKSETKNFKQSLQVEIVLNKTRARAMEQESKTNELKRRAQMYSREIQILKIAEMKAKRKFAELTSKIIIRKELCERLQVKEEQFHKRQESFLKKHQFFKEKISEATTTAESAERRIMLLQSKVLELRKEICRQTSETRKMFVLKNELEHLSLEY